MTIKQTPSPNYSSRQGYKPELIVIHCTDGYFPSDLEYLQNPDPGGPVGPVSAHFLVSPLGDVYQLVDTNNMAWHAGRVDRPTAKLKPGINPNLYSIGIETSLRATDLISASQKVPLVELIKSLCTQYSIPMDRDHIVGHHEIYFPKTCPGTINVTDLISPVDVNELLKQKLSLLQQLLALYQKLTK